MQKAIVLIEATTIIYLFFITDWTTGLSFPHGAILHVKDEFPAFEKWIYQHCRYHDSIISIISIFYTYITAFIFGNAQSGVRIIYFLS